VNFTSNSQFQQAKQYGIGQGILKKFLGDNWKDHDIQHALTAIKGYKDQAIDKDAVQTFKEKRHATVFMEQVREKKIPVEKQKEIAERKNTLSFFIDEWQINQISKKLTQEFIFSWTTWSSKTKISGILSSI
jgi:hypothetical protein